jgi:aminoglycoside phosphotransferase (APT) family kinase protein
MRAQVARWNTMLAVRPRMHDDEVDITEELARRLLESQLPDLALRAVPVAGAPTAGNRARPVQEYDRDTRAAIQRAGTLDDADAAVAVREEALEARRHDGAPVWVHGDLDGNCIVDGGRLCGVVDWGAAGAGDPAVDVQVAWSPLFTEASRSLFLDAVAADVDTIARSRGAAVNEACAALPYYLYTYPLIVERSWHKLDALGVGRRT